MNGLVSVVIPLFNREKYIQRSVRSVLDQTYKDLEVLVVDDGSTDKGVEVVRQISDKRIRLFKQENGGVSAARNRGIQEARADLIAFLDADDAYRPDFIERILGLRDKYPKAGAYATNFEVVDRSGVKKTRVSLPEEGTKVFDVGSFFRMSIIRCPVCSSAVAVKKEVFGRVGAFPSGIRMGEDLDMWIRIIFSYPIVVDGRVAVTYYWDVDDRACEINTLEKEPVFFQTIDLLRERNPELYQEEQDSFQEFKNRFIIQYAGRQILALSARDGREILLKCHTRVFWARKWKWIIISFLPMRLYYWFRSIKRRMQDFLRK